MPFQTHTGYIVLLHCYIPQLLFSKDLSMFLFYKGVNSECDPAGSIGSHFVSILPLQLTVHVNHSCVFAEHVQLITQALKPALRL